MSLDRITTTDVARGMTVQLLGDADWMMHDGRKAYTYFTGMTLREAQGEFKQLSQLGLGDRLRDLMERMGYDGRLSA